MDRAFQITGWQERWLRRESEPLQLETTVAAYAITIAALGISLHQLFTLRRARKLINQGGDPAVILAASDRTTKRALNIQHRLSWLLVLHSIALWLVDASIGLLALQSDVAASPDFYTSRTWTHLLIYALGLFTLFSLVLIFTPFLQFLAVASFLRATNPHSSSVSALLPPARAIAAHLGFLWVLLGFGMVAWWPTCEASLLRVVLLEAAFGSGLSWMHASTLLAGDAVARMHVDDVSVHSGVQRLVGFAAKGPQERPVLPRFEQADEKAALLADTA